MLASTLRPHTMKPNKRLRQRTLLLPCLQPSAIQLVCVKRKHQADILKVSPDQQAIQLTSFYKPKKVVCNCNRVTRAWSPSMSESLCAGRVSVRRVVIETLGNWGDGGGCWAELELKKPKSGSTNAAGEARALSAPCLLPGAGADADDDKCWWACHGANELWSVSDCHRSCCLLIGMHVHVEDASRLMSQLGCDCSSLAMPSAKCSTLCQFAFANAHPAATVTATVTVTVLPDLVEQSPT